MDLLQRLVALASNKMLFLYTEPEVIDFTAQKEFKLTVMGKDDVVDLEFTESNLVDMSSILKSVFPPEIVLCCWNIKNMFSALRHWLKRPYELDGKLIDLKVIGAYLGDREIRRPVDFNTVVERFKSYVACRDHWKKVYSSIHLPLIKEVLPALENVGAIDTTRRRLVYAHYEIEGSKNGRLTCPVAFECGFNPHSLGPAQRDVLKPCGNDNLFVHFDFKNMEVGVLQFLSQDENLKEMLGKDEDFYSQLFQLFTGKPCNEDRFREFSKMLFLPVVFGLSAKTIVKDYKISEKFANHIIDTLHTKFPSAMSFVEKNQNDNGLADYLGRVRKFDDNSATKARNFVIQSPAATVCLEKLINLKTLTKKIDVSLAFHVHDGYYLYVRKDKCNYVAKTVRDELEKPSELLPGLKLKATCKIGPTLNSLEPFEVGKESNDT